MRTNFGVPTQHPCPMPFSVLRQRIAAQQLARLFLSGPPLHTGGVSRSFVASAYNRGPTPSPQAWESMPAQGAVAAQQPFYQGGQQPYQNYSQGSQQPNQGQYTQQQAPQYQQQQAVQQGPTHDQYEPEEPGYAGDLLFSFCNFSSRLYFECCILGQALFPWLHEMRGPRVESVVTQTRMPCCKLQCH